MDALSSHRQLDEENIINLSQGAVSEVKARTPVPEDSQGTTPRPVRCIKTDWLSADFKAEDYMVSSECLSGPAEIISGQGILCWEAVPF